MPADLFRFEDFELDQAAYELRRGGQSVRLERIPFELLSLLVERGGQLVRREEIVERIWGKGVFHDTEHGINTAVRKIRLALQDDSDSPRFVLTVPAKGYRFLAPVERVAPSAVDGPAATAEGGKPPIAEAGKWTARARILLPAAVLLGVVAAWVFYHFHRAPALSETDTIVIADFNNTTGDPVFDDTLKQALSVELSQSPFLNLASEEQIRQTMRMMKQPPDARLTPEVAREVCQRTNGAAVLEGSIAQIGTQYDLILKAVNCSTGEPLASTEARANDKNHILEALGKASLKIREKLGESLLTLQKFDIPLVQATTPSLEALKAYSLGLSKNARGDQAGAIPLFQKAIELDPDFAMAYVRLGVSYNVLGEYRRSEEPLRKAYALRDRANEREKFEIVSVFHQQVTQQMDQAIQDCELWEQSYPRDFRPHLILGFENGALGRHERSAEEFRKAMELDPRQSLPYAGLLTDYPALNRLAEADAVYKQAQTHNVSAGEVERLGYLLAFVEGDTAMMAKRAASLSKEPGYEGRALLEESHTAAYFGHLEEARKLSRRSEEMAEREKDRGTAAEIESDAGVREALFGNPDAAASHAAAAMKLGGQPVMALAGDTSQAMKVMDQFASQTPPGSFYDKFTLPEFRGAIELKRGNAIRALELLAPAESSEGGWYDLYMAAYLRGEAYLLAHRSQEAAAEFQKIIDHRGVVLNFPIGALAHLQLGRAYALSGETTNAKSAYHDFLTLWKDADPDVPIFKQAKVEYAKLQ
jgi:DNA-binding winged helix-turn-helix (wHTH) protein/tetratricopeptide (TPR) repeat protein